MITTMLLEFVASIAMESFFFCFNFYAVPGGGEEQTKVKIKQEKTWEDLLFHSSPVYP